MSARRLPHAYLILPGSTGRQQLASAEFHPPLQSLPRPIAVNGDVPEAARADLQFGTAKGLKVCAVRMPAAPPLAAACVCGAPRQAQCVPHALSRPLLCQRVPRRRPGRRSVCLTRCPPAPSSPIPSHPTPPQIINTGHAFQIEWDTLEGTNATVPVRGDQWGAFFDGTDSLGAAEDIRRVPVKPLQVWWLLRCSWVESAGRWWNRGPA